MRPLNEVAAWVYQEIAQSEAQLPKAHPQDQLWLKLRIDVLNQVIERIKRAAQREGKRQKRSLRGVWNQHDSEVMNDWD